MASKKIIYYILIFFIAGCFLLIYIQYNSAKNTGSLINGNEKLVAEFNVGNELKDLQKGVFSIESKVRGTVTTNDSSFREGVDSEIENVKNKINQLQNISDDSLTVKYIDVLDTLVQKKLTLNREILNSFYTSGKPDAENLIANHNGKKLTDSIVLVAQLIESTRNKILEATTLSNDISGKKVQNLSTILTVLVLISAAILFWFIISIIRKQGQLIHELNISEKKVKEAAEVKEKFMANMSHEIRTPMNAILGFTNLLQRKTLDNESREYVQTIQKSGENLLTIINDILDISKIEAGMLRIESAPFSIRSLVHSIEIMFAAKAAEKQLKIFTEVDTSVPDILEGDAVRLSQILVNLIGNSLKFTSNGNITINIINQGISNDMIKTGIRISDTGIGIEKEKLNHVFERFSQAEDSVTRKYGGTGLGLSIVNELVLLQNGNIKVESAPGKGTTFIAVIPYKISVEKAGVELLNNNDALIPFNFEHVHILVVEDNETNQNLIRHLFGAWQINFDLANNGREAVENLQAKKYDLILMDIQMPEMDGYTAVQTIRNTLKIDTPIIAMTAHAMAGEKEKCISYGMNDYISKPIREDLLQKLITQYTHKPAVTLPSNRSPANHGAQSYQYINLHYMQDISLGNIEFEKNITQQFIEAIPKDLSAFDEALQNNNIKALSQLAHNMKTTVSVMGLNEKLQPYLDALEYETLSDEMLRSNLGAVKQICDASLKEACIFLATL